jgi:Tol biopolymer transport system component
MGRQAGAVVVAVALIAACNAHLGDPTTHVTGDPDGGALAVDTGVTSDATVTLGAWGTPIVVPGASSTANNEDDPTLSSDGLELYYAVQVPGNPKDLYVMKRASKTAAFGTPAALIGFNTLAGSEESPRLAYDDLTIYFGRDGDIYKATRASTSAAWSAPSLVTGVSTPMYEKWLAVCGDGTHIMVSRDNGTAMAPNPELFEGTFADGAATVATVLDSIAAETSTFVSKDCLSVMYASNRSGQTQIYTSTRTAIGSAWDPPALLGAPFDTGTDNEDPGYTPDNHIFVFAGLHAPLTTKDVYLSTR